MVYPHINSLVAEFAIVIASRTLDGRALGLLLALPLPCPVQTELPRLAAMVDSNPAMQVTIPLTCAMQAHSSTKCTVCTLMAAHEEGTTF